MAVYRSEIRLPNDHYLAIGKIIAHWSIFEWCMKRALGVILGLPEREERALFAETQLSEILRATKLAISLRLSGADADLDIGALLLSIILEAENSIGDRNLVAHALWARAADNKLHIMKYKGGKNFEKRIIGEPVPMEYPEIITKQETADRLSFMAWQWLRTWQAAHAPSQGKSS